MTHEKNDQVGHVPHGGRDDLGPAAPPQLSHDAEIHRCRKCGTLWRRWRDGNYSLIENKPAGSCCDNAPMGEQIEQLWPHASNSGSNLRTLQLRIDFLEGTALPHARKQEHADGFRVGWHAALTRIREGDDVEDLSALIGSATQASDAKRAETMRRSEAK